MFTSGSVQYCGFSLSPKKFFVIFLIFFVQRVASEDSVRPWNYTSLDQLRMQLFTNYDKFLHPTYRGVPTNITLGMTVNYIDIDELNGKMTLHGWAKIKWIDEKFLWNDSDYNNISRIHFKSANVWTPKIILINSADDSNNHMGSTHTIVYSDGHFLWIPPVTYTVYCHLNLRLWPHDSHTCTVKIGAWATTIDKMGLEPIEYDELVQSTEWEIVSSNAEFHHAPYYDHAVVTFNLQRRSTMYAAVIYIPAFCIVLLTLSIFWLPSQMGEKILLNGFVIIVVAIYLMYFAQLFPIMAENTPLIAMFFSSSLILLSLSIIVSTIVLYLSRVERKKRLPTGVQNLLNGTLGQLLFLSNFRLETDAQTTMISDAKELDDQTSINREVDTPNPVSMIAPAAFSARLIKFDWILLATAVDRIFFICYCIIFIILAIAFVI